MKNFVTIQIFLLFIAFSFFSCHSLEEEKKYVIGVSQCMLNDAWRQAMVKEMQLEATNYDNIEIIVKDAQSNNETQIQQIRELMERKVDILIISPFQSQPITVVAEEAYRAGIPTIITDRKVNTDLYTTYVGASNYDIGYAAGKYANSYLPQHAVILEIWGLSSSSPAQERHQGFVGALLQRPDLSFVKIEGQWLPNVTMERLKDGLLPDKIDFVYAHNDMMAISARDYFIQHRPDIGHTLPIIGVDAVPGAGLEAVADGRINASFMYPTGGEQVIRTAMQILNGESTDRHISLATSVPVDRQGAQTLLLQSKQMQHYQQRIEQQRSRLDHYMDRFRFLKDSLWVISVLMMGLVLLSIYVFIINRRVRHTNRELREINRKEEEQREKLISLNAEIKEVTAQKLQFFTNVSHEVRTPLTLILGPLDRLIGQMQDSPYRPDIELIHRNAARLLRVINQILDFRKIENGEEKLKIREVDAITFATEVKTYFNSMAAARQITYTFTSDVKTLFVWMDSDRIEKVLVNLLSNAFKFTPEKGNIRVRVADAGSQVQIAVEDDGRGIRPEHLSRVFDRFYTENSPSGTGIGLHLVQEYIRLHHGEVTVESVPNVRTIFTVSLHKDKNHFTEGTLTAQSVDTLSYEASCLDDTTEKELLATYYSYTILVVEDDDEVRSYLKRELEGNFTILTAINGKEALAILEGEDVSLILSDVMMPEINGFELCRLVKNDLSFSHIPVILLTALSDERQKTFAISGGADDYIQKPFETNFVKLKMIRLLEERKRFREQLLQKLQAGNLLQAEPGKIENMDDQFLRRFLTQIEAVYSDPEYNVEKLSDILGLSRGHLHRKMKELTGTSPVEFLRNYRLNKASQLLKQGELSISEIAYATGFTSPAYFSKCFRQVYSLTPSEYK